MIEGIFTLLHAPDKDKYATQCFSHLEASEENMSKEADKTPYISSRRGGSRVVISQVSDFWSQSSLPLPDALCIWKQGGC